MSRNISLLVAFAGLFAWFHSSIQLPVLGMILFLLYAVIFALVPGLVLMKLLRVELPTLAERLIVGNAVGFASFCYISWILNAKVGLQYESFLLFPTGMWLVYLAGRLFRASSESERGHSIRELVRRKSWFPAIAVLSLGCIYVHAMNFTMTEHGALINNYAQEGMWHVGNVAWTKHTFEFRDIHSGANYGIPYHHFLYIFASIFSKISTIETAVVWFKLVPFYLMFSVAASVFTVLRLFVRPRAAFFGMLIVLFLENASVAFRALSYIYSLATDTPFARWALFEVRPFVSFFLDSPSHGAGTFCLMAILLLLKYSFDSSSWKMHVLPGFLIGGMLGVKANMFVVLAISLFLYAAFRWGRRREVQPVMVGVVAFFFSLPFLVEVMGTSVSGYVWSPGHWIWKSESGKWIGDQSVLRIVLAFAVYTLLQLGPRFLAFRWFYSDWKSHDRKLCQFMWIAVATSLFLFYFFVQRNQDHTIKYMYYVASILLTIMLVRVFDQVQRRRKIILAALCLPFMSGWTGYVTLSVVEPRMIITIPEERIDAMRAIREEHAASAPTRMMCSRARYGPTARGGAHIYFFEYSALAEQIAFSEGFTQIRLSDVPASELAQRKRDADSIYSTHSEIVAMEILNRHGIDYLIVDKDVDQVLKFTPTQFDLFLENRHLLIYRRHRDY